MVRKRKSILYLLVGVVAIMLLPLFNIVECASNPVLTMSGMTSSEIQLVTSTMKNINKNIIENQDETGISKTQVITVENVSPAGTKEGQKIINVTFNTSIYKDLEQLQKQKVMGLILNSIENSSMSQISRSKLYSFISNSDETTSNLVRQLSNDVNADFVEAYSSFKPFTGTIGWVLGILTLAIFLLLGISIVIDMAYIVIPLVQNVLSPENSSAKPKYISHEAWTAIKEAESGVGSGKAYKEPMGLYFKLKTKQFLAIGICLLYLVSGQIYNLIARIMDSFSGLFG